MTLPPTEMVQLLLENGADVRLSKLDLVVSFPAGVLTPERESNALLMAQLLLEYGAIGICSHIKI